MHHIRLFGYPSSHNATIIINFEPLHSNGAPTNNLGHDNFNRNVPPADLSAKYKLRIMRSNVRHESGRAPLN